MPVARVVLAAVSGEGRPLLLVLRALGLGDLLTALPALHALRAAFPSHRLVLAAPRALAPLAELSGAVGAVADTAPLAALEPALAGADLAVNLHGRGPQSHRVLLETRPRRLVAFEHHEVPESHGGPAWRADEHEVTRWCRLLAESGIPSDPARLELPAPADETLGESGLTARGAAQAATLIHPGSASPARRWPPERFAAVACAERAEGRPVVVTGSRAETGLAECVARGAGLPDEAMLAGATDLLGLAAAVAAADRVVCADTGVAHLATALGTPSVVLFGPTSPQHWGPPLARSLHRALWTGRSGDPHGRESDAGLLELGVEEVVAALRALPLRAAPAHGAEGRASASARAASASV